jgi:hypothetical protein
MAIDANAIETTVVGAALIGAGKVVWAWLTSQPGERWKNIVGRWEAVVAVLALFVALVALLMPQPKADGDQWIAGKWDGDALKPGWRADKLELKQVDKQDDSKASVLIDYSRYNFKSAPIVMVVPNAQDIARISVEEVDERSARVRMLWQTDFKSHLIDRPFMFVIFPKESWAEPK